MQHLHALCTEDALEIKIGDIQRSADLACAVVGNSGAAAANAGVRDIELMAVAPRTALLNLCALICHAAAAKITLDKCGDRAALNKGSEDLYRQSEIGRDARNICLGTCSLHLKGITAMNRLSVRGGDSHAHARRYNKRPTAIFSEFFHFSISSFRNSFL